MCRSLRLTALFLLVFTLLSLASHAQTAVRVADLDPGTFAASSSPADLTVVGTKLFFTAGDNSANRRDLWVTDGTSGGTRKLARICEGFCPSLPTLAGTSRLLFFAVAYGGLWRTDGTPQGTFRVADLYSGSLTVAGNSAYFSVGPWSPDYRYEAWRSDGTVAGTSRLGDLSLTVEHGGPPRFAILGGKVFFFARDAAGNPALWRSSGKDASPVAVVPGRNGRQLTAAAGRLFFLAGEEETDEELWISDGTPASTRRLTSFARPDPFQPTLALIPGDHGVVFAVDDGSEGPQVWKSDGTTVGTVRATDFASENPFGSLRLDPAQAAWLGERLLTVADGGDGFRLWVQTGSGLAVPLGPMEASPYTGLLRLGNQVFFRADDGTHGFELWRTDGTVAGTRMVRDICPGFCGSQLMRPLLLNGRAVFLARDPVQGPQLWSSDGTASGTRRVTNLPAGAFVPVTFEATALGPELFFPATDSQHGQELWSAGGPASEGRLVADLLPFGDSANPWDMVGLGDRVIFSACSRGIRDLWSSKGTPESTVLLAHPGYGYCGSRQYQPRNMTVAGPWAFFIENQLWRTDGTPAGTLPLISGARNLVAWGRQALFSREGELWTSNGTVEGTQKLARIPSNALNWDGGLAALGQDIYLGGSEGLFHADGLTSTVVQISPEPRFEGPAHFTRAGPLVYFVARSSQSYEIRIWRTDGTRAGTFPVSPPLWRQPLDLIEYEGNLYFFLSDGLWRTDGTVEGTVLLHELVVDYDENDDPLSAELTVAAGGLVFAARDDSHDRELWTSDGTAQGTLRVADVGPAGSGPIPGSPFGLAATGGRVWFSGFDPDHGAELWSSDGTAAGTRLVQDLAPGDASSDPQELTFTAGRLWFSANDGLTGRELWSLSLSDLVCRPAPGRLCLSGGRFAVTVDWRDRAGKTGMATALPIADGAGAFWINAPDNLEIAVKIVDGRAVNQSFWLFYGGLTDLDYWITVNDTVTGLTRRYANPSGTLTSGGDTRAFGPWGAQAQAPHSPPLRTLPGAESARDRAAVPGVCIPSAVRLCLNGGRFAVEARWRDFAGRTGAAMAMPLTSGSGSFGFSDPASPELVVKLVDGRLLNGKFWFFSGALTNLEYTLTVTDTTTGAVRTWHNPLGRFSSVGDTEAF